MGLGSTLAKVAAASADAVSGWAEGVKHRTMHPLEALAAEANRWRNIPRDKLMDEVAGNLTGGVGGLASHTAWHGSPHLFDKFKSEAIGTGEGAQAYGMGHYLAEAPVVGKEYQKNLSENRLFYPDGKPFDERTTLLNRNVRATITKTNGNIDAAVERGKQVIANLPPESQGAQYAAQDIQTLLKIKESGGINRQGGALYKTDIPDAHIDKMLDWDKPLSEQHPDVQDAVKQWGDFSPADTGQAIYRRFSGGAASGHNAQAASSDLQQLGIPGIKYLDGTSRTAGEGTRNFVLFDPSDIRILERNGVPTGQVPWSADSKPLNSLNPTGSLFVDYKFLHRE